jgi:hypothetical protein
VQIHDQKYNEHTMWGNQTSTQSALPIAPNRLHVQAFDVNVLKK